ncbi:MAG: glycosyltransferase [Hydrogenophilales bacterium]|nr:glycosyltransferase [Hydrogenophilales bacterium]
MIYISYGIPKSASSFVYQLTQSAVGALADKEGLRNFTLTELFPACANQGFAEEAMRTEGLPLDANGLAQLVDLIDARLVAQGGGFITIKTHLGCSDPLRKRVAAGDVKASACYRHPAEMILSRMDMVARKAEEVSSEQIKGYYIKDGIPNFMSWVAEPNVRRFYYDTIVQSPEVIAAQICNQLGISIEPEHLLRPLLSDKSRIWQFNKGVLHRHQAEMSPEEIAQIELDFVDYMNFIERAKKGLGDFYFAVVTPSLNSAATINETILSVVSQRGDFAIRYHVQDGGSTDGTIDLLERWNQLLGESNVPWLGCKRVDFSYAVKPDDGVYDALNLAFEHVSGDVYTVRQ